MKRSRIKEFLFVVLCYVVHASVYASQVTLWTQLNDQEVLMEAFINLMSAVCASMANTVFRLKNSEIVVDRVFIELVSGIGVGLVAGLITYSVSKAAGANVFLQLALVTLAGWGGSKIIEWYTDKYFGRTDQKGS